MFPDGDPTANVPPSAMRPDVGDVPSDQWRERATIAKDALELDFQRRKVRTLQAEVERLREEVAHWHGGVHAHIGACEVAEDEIKRLRDALTAIRDWQHDPMDTYSYDAKQMQRLAGDALSDAPPSDITALPPEGDR